jgi:ABC-2 type transport system ATP-binding protein
MTILRIDRLNKSFGGNHVIRDLSLDVPEGAIFGFLGQNGAGKTTTMKMILALLNADSGTIEVCGERVRFGRAATNRHIGYLPDAPAYYGFLRPREYLRLCGEIAGMARGAIDARAEELLRLVGLSDANKRIGGFSRGMKQRLGIAQALLGEPRLLICDEPTSALDPVGRKEILDILGGLRGRATVLFSTHILSDAERICDRVAVLRGGALAVSGSLEQLRADHPGGGLLIEFSNAADLAACAAQFPNATAAGLRLEIDAPDIDAAQRTLMRFLADRGILPLRIERKALTLEHLFLEAVR